MNDERNLRSDYGHGRILFPLVLVLFLLSCVVSDPMKKGMIAEDNGKYFTAERYYQQALKEDATNIRAHERLADLYRRQGMPARALRHAAAVLRTEPGSVSGHLHAGASHALMKNHETAIFHLLQALEKDPELEEGHVIIAGEYLALGNRVRAMIHLKKACRLGHAPSCRLVERHMPQQ